MRTQIRLRVKPRSWVRKDWKEAKGHAVESESDVNDVNENMHTMNESTESKCIRSTYAQKRPLGPG